MREHKVKLLLVLALLAIALGIFAGFRLTRGRSPDIAPTTPGNHVERAKAADEHDAQAGFPSAEPAPTASSLSASSRAVLPEFTLSPGKGGPIRNGMTIDELYSAVGRGNTKLREKYPEGMPSTFVEIYLMQSAGSEPSLEAELQDDSVYRFTVFDSRFMTDKGIGVGSTLGEIRQAYKVDWISFEEGSLFARSDQVGMSFVLDRKNLPAGWQRNLQLIPDSAKVTSILVVP